MFAAQIGRAPKHGVDPGWTLARQCLPGKPQRQNPVSELQGIRAWWIETGGAPSLNRSLEEEDLQRIAYVLAIYVVIDLGEELEIRG